MAPNRHPAPTKKRIGLASAAHDCALPCTAAGAWLPSRQVTEHDALRARRARIADTVEAAFRETGRPAAPAPAHCPIGARRGRWTTMRPAVARND